MIVTYFKKNEPCLCVRFSNIFGRTIQPIIMIKEIFHLERQCVEPIGFKEI